MINPIKSALATVLLLTSLSAKDSASDEILNKMINVYGGEKNIIKMSNYEQVWLIEAKAGNSNGSDHRRVSLPDSLSTELTYPDKKERRVLVEGYGVKEFGDKKVVASGPMLDAMKLQLMRLYNPLVLKNRAQNIELGSDDANYILTLKEGELETKYFVSKRDYLIEKVVGKLSFGAQSMEFVTLYKNYEKKEGVMMPTIEVKYAGDVNTAVMKLQAVKLFNK